MTEKQISEVIASGNNVYIVGIKGAGVAGLAQILKAKEFNISGSDIKEKFFTDAILKKAGIKYYEGFSKRNISKNIKNINWAISSNAYLGKGVNNPEIEELERRKIPILKYSEALSYFFNNSFGIAIAGTHGKTSTSAALAFILDYAGLKPNALIGSKVVNWGSNAMVGTSNIFVLEADEYKDAFLQYKPDIITILNTDWDHPDYFKTFAEYKKAFEKFKKKIKPGGKIFTPKDLYTKPIKFKTSLIGKHNQENFNAAYKIARYLGIKASVIKEAISKFKGTTRRLEIVGKHKGNIVIDDYAHNSQKVAAALKGLKHHYPKKKIIVVFQPHTFSRTEQFLKDFAEALIIADEIHLLDIYSSAREVKGTISSDDLVLEINRLGCDAINLKTIKNAVKYFKDNPPKNAVIAAMGAGDVGDVAHLLAKK